VSEESDLEKAHAQLVEQRRLIIEALAKGDRQGQTEKRSQTDENIERLLKYQSAIDVLDILMAEDEDEDEDEGDEDE
jgi:hypothetical protein